MTSGRGGWINRDPRWSVLENEGEEPVGGTDAGDGSESLDSLLTAAVRELRRPVTLDAALDGRIMAAVHAEGAPGAVPTGLTAEWDRVPETPVSSAARAAHATPTRRQAAVARAAAAAWSWLREPRTLRVSPLGGLLGAAAAAAVTVFAVQAGRGDGSGPQAAPDVAAASVPAAPAVVAGEPVQVVQFVLVAPTARSVALVGDFNDWDSGATPLRAAGNGRRVWSVEVPLEPGRHRYAFVVDGEEWVADPAAPRAPGADFGEPSSVVTVVERRS